MPTESETIAAEKMRRKRIVAILGNCQDCGQPVIAGQEFLQSDNGIQHALCFYDPAYAKRVRELRPNAGR
jgi:hypothetical protein